LATFFSFLIVLSVPAQVNSEAGEQRAQFTKVTYSPRIPAGTQDRWTFTVHNIDCSENDQSTARFFLIFYDDNRLWLDEYNMTNHKTWFCNRSGTVTRTFDRNGWQVTKPVTHDLRVELYWYNNGTSHLEDTTSFSIGVTLHIPFQHILATGYLVAYLIACFVIFVYDYVQGLDA
jgi:hypothetical protein